MFFYSACDDAPASFDVISPFRKESFSLAVFFFFWSGNEVFFGARIYCDLFFGLCDTSLGFFLQEGTLRFDGDFFFPLFIVQASDFFLNAKGLSLLFLEDHPYVRVLARKLLGFDQDQFSSPWSLSPGLLQ